MAADEGIQRQFHRAVFLAGAAPARDEKVFRDNRQLVKHEQQQQIEAQEDPIDAADEREVEGEKLLGPLLNVPGKQDSAHRRESGQNDQHEADAVCGEIVIGADRGNPIRFDNRGDFAGVRLMNRANKSHHATGDGREQGDDAGRARVVARQEHQHQHPDERNVNSPGEHGQISDFRFPISDFSESNLCLSVFIRG